MTNITVHGFWLLVDDREYFVPFSDCPVFKSATIEPIFAVQRISPAQFHWPALDADIELAALERPESFPFAFRS